MRSRPTYTIGLATLIIAGFGTNVPAQTRSGASSDLTSIMLEEIVVTVRRREENAQNVPVTVTAITAENLTSRSTLLLSDIAKETPSLTIQARTSDRNTQVVSLRGQVQADSVATVDPSVGIYLNDIYVARDNGANFELFDVDRVEVLAGPQGTLYGRNTTGGAIKLVTAAADPSAPFGGYGLVSGGNFDARRVEAAINAPLSDTFALRLAGLSLQRDGYGKTIVGSLAPSPTGLDPMGFGRDGATAFTPRKVFDTDNKNIKAGRVSATFEPTNNLSFSLVGDYSKQADNGATGYDVGNTLITTPVGTQVTVLGMNAPLFFGGSSKCSTDFYTTCQDTRPTSEAEIYGAALTSAYATDFGTAKLIYGYRNVDASYNTNLDGSQIAFISVAQPSKVHQNSVEAQFLGQTNSLDYTLGLYYFNEVGTEKLSDATAATPTLDIARRVLKGDVENESKSVYGQAGYALTNRLRLTLGARYTRDDKELVSSNVLLPNLDVPTGICLFSLNNQPPPVAAPTPANCRFARNDSFDHLSWTVGLDWQINDKYLTYIKGSDGYRSGGQNLRGLTPATQRPFKEETIRDIELGLKSRPFERLQLNLTYYHSDYEDIQTTLFQFVAFPQNTTTFVLNQGAADIDGVELQSTIVATKNLSFDLTGSYNNFNFESDLFVPPLTPKYKGSAAANLLWPTRLGDWSARVSYSYQDEFFVTNQAIEAATIKQATIGSRGLVDARVSVNLKQYGLNIAFFGTNLTNKEYFENGTLFTLPVDGMSSANGVTDVFNRLQVGAPRLYGVEIRKQF